MTVTVVIHLSLYGVKNDSTIITRIINVSQRRGREEGDDLRDVVAKTVKDVNVLIIFREGRVRQGLDRLARGNNWDRAKGRRFVTGRPSGPNCITWQVRYN